MRNNRPLVLVDKNRLPVSGSWLYIPVAGVNPSAGFSSLITRAGSRLISVKRYFYARNPSHIRIMAGRDWEAFAPAGFSSTSLLTRSRLATPFSSEVARLPKNTRGAANMATSARLPERTSSRLNHNPLPLFVFLFAAVSRADLTDHTPHMVRIAAPDELTARRSLVGRYVLSFAGRLPAQEVHHV